MFRKLGEIDPDKGDLDLLTVRCTNARLIREPKPTLLVEIDNEMEVLTTSGQRGEHAKATSGWLADQLEKWRKTEVSEITVATREHPLEVVTGDIVLIPVIEGRKHLLTFYRDIYPKGWLLPGGCPQYMEELFDPKDVGIREAGEEVLITDDDGVIYCPFSTDALSEVVPAWKRARGLLNPRENPVSLITRELPPVKGDAQNLVVGYYCSEKKTSNITVMIAAPYASVSTTTYMEVDIPFGLANLRIFDGEIFNGTLLNRPARLTDKKGKLIALFSRGDNLLLAGWNTPSVERVGVIP